MRYRLICWMLLGWFVAGYGYAQIRGGAETARFEPGDRILYQEDLSGTPIGEQVEGWEILQGSYEVAEFQDRRSRTTRTSSAGWISRRTSLWSSPFTSLSRAMRN